MVMTAIGGRDVMVKKIRMDRMAATDARDVISWEAEQYVPFDMESVQLDFQILDPASDGPQMNVLLVAAKKDLVEQRVMLLEDAELAPAVVDVDAFALFNAFEFNYPSSARGVAVLVNVGHEVATIIVHEDGVPIVTRDVPFGSKHIREDLRRLHGLTPDEAEQVLRGGARQGSDVAKLLYERGAELAQAIERATAFLGADMGAAAGINAVYLSGGAARMPGLQEAVSERLRVRTEVVNPFQRIDVAPDAMADLPDESSAAMWMLPIGLALRAPA
jgi:type IV pilus assembly protein PilM